MEQQLTTVVHGAAMFEGVTHAGAMRGVPVWFFPLPNILLLKYQTGEISYEYRNKMQLNMTLLKDELLEWVCTHILYNVLFLWMKDLIHMSVLAFIQNRYTSIYDVCIYNHVRNVLKCFTEKEILLTLWTFKCNL